MYIYIENYVYIDTDVHACPWLHVGIAYFAGQVPQVLQVVPVPSSEVGKRLEAEGFLPPGLGAETLRKCVQSPPTFFEGERFILAVFCLFLSFVFSFSKGRDAST